MKDKLTKFRRNNGTNLLDVTVSELEKLGYKQRHFILEHKSRIIPHCFAGDLLCATNKEKNLFIEIDDKTAKFLDPAKFLVYYI